MHTTDNPLLEKVKEVFATAGFLILFISILLVIGFVISKTPLTSNVSDIKTERECRDKGHAWHSVEGCFTQEGFIDRYIDK